MNWTVEFDHRETPIVDAWQMNQLRFSLADAIEDWLEEFVPVDGEDELAPWCEYCAQERGTHHVSVYEECPTDRGTERREMEYWMCDRCDPRSAP
jgi:hypothetical protein